MKQVNLSKVVKAIEGDVKAGAKHLDILKGLTFSASIDAEEVKAIVATYENAYKEYKISSHNIYKNYYGRVLITGVNWIKYFIQQEGLSKSSCTRDDLLNKVLFTAKKLNSKKISYYKRLLKDIVKDVDDKIDYLNNLLKAGVNAILVDPDDDNILKDVITSMIEAEADRLQRVKEGLNDDVVVDDTDVDGLNDDVVVDDTDVDGLNDDVVDVDNLEDTNEARINYIIEKLTILNKSQLDRVVSLIDSF